MGGGGDFRYKSGYTFAGDFNGDGKTDIASAVGSQVHVHLSTGNGFDNQIWTVPDRWGGPGYTFSGDFNGDNVTDIITMFGSTINFLKSNKDSFTSIETVVRVNWGGPEYTRVHRHGIFTMNGPMVSSIRVDRDTGQAFVSEYRTSSAWGSPGYTFIGDFNGDGADDIASASGRDVTMRLTQYRKPGFKIETWVTPGLWGGPGYTKVCNIVNMEPDERDDIVSANGREAYVYRPDPDNQRFIATTYPITAYLTPAPASPWGGDLYTYFGQWKKEKGCDMVSALGSTIFFHSQDRFNTPEFVFGSFDSVN